jgi:mRNA interferase RelE/StbE
MLWRIQIEKRAQKTLLSIPPSQRQRIRLAIRALGEAPRPQGCKKLSNSEYWRIRVGVYRVLYKIEEKRLLILVVKVGHRREVYR